MGIEILATLPANNLQHSRSGIGQAVRIHVDRFQSVVDENCPARDASKLRFERTESRRLHMTEIGPIAVIPRAKSSPIAEVVMMPTVILISHFKIQGELALACHAAFPEEKDLRTRMKAGSAP